MKYEITMQVLPLADLIHAPYNPREEIIKGSDEYIHLKKSLRDHGQTEPLVVNLHNMHVVGGNQRMTVMLDMGWTEALCTVFTQEDLLREKKIAIALNKITGRWDTDKLGDILRDDDVIEFETGFDRDEVMSYRHLEELRDDSDDDNHIGDFSDADEPPFDEPEDDVDGEVDGALMPEDGPEPTTLIRIGHLRFKCELTRYKCLINNIRDRGIFDEKEIAAEMKRRLLYD